MNLYLDENMAGGILVTMLRNAHHAVSVPVDAELIGVTDPRQFAHAIQSNLVIVTQDRDDFRDLHDLVVTAGGAHPGVLFVCHDNDPTHDMTPRGIVTAIGKLEASGVPLANHVYFLNQWR